MFTVAQAPPDHAHRLRTQRNRRTSFCGRRSRCGADLIAAAGDRCPVGATADGSRADDGRSEEHTSELQSHLNLLCRLLLEKKKNRERSDIVVRQYTTPFG